MGTKTSKHNKAKSLPVLNHAHHPTSSSGRHAKSYKNGQRSKSHGETNSPRIENMEAGYSKGLKVRNYGRDEKFKNHTKSRSQSRFHFANIREIERMSRKELKKSLNILGLSTEGTHEILVERLIDCEDVVIGSKDPDNNDSPPHSPLASPKIIRNKLAHAEPLQVAARNGHISAVRLLVNQRANVESRTDDGSTALSLACQNGHKAVVKVLLDAGARTNTKRKDGATPLHLSCACKNESIAKALIYKSANVEATWRGGATPLLVAASNGMFNTIELLVVARAKVNVRLKDGATPLYIASESGYAQVVQRLVQNGAKVNYNLRSGASPLYIASQNDHFEVARVLLEEKAWVNATRMDGATPLYIASENGNARTVKLLLSYSAGQTVLKENKATPLYIAAQNGHTKTVKLLIDCHANPDVRRTDGVTPLIISSANGHESTLQMLLLKQANVNARQVDGASSLFVASEYGHVRCVRLLLEARADFKKFRADRTTPLFAAVENSHVEVVQLLLKVGAPVNSEREDKVVPLMCAAASGNEQIVKMLVYRGANLKSRSSTGTTALHEACVNGHENVARYLIRKRASINARRLDGSTPFYLATKHGYVNIARLLLTEKAEIKSKPGGNWWEAGTRGLNRKRKEDEWSDVDRHHEDELEVVAIDTYRSRDNSYSQSRSQSIVQDGMVENPIEYANTQSPPPRKPSSRQKRMAARFTDKKYNTMHSRSLEQPHEDDHDRYDEYQDDEFDEDLPDLHPRYKLSRKIRVRQGQNKKNIKKDKKDKKERNRRQVGVEQRHPQQARHNTKEEQDRSYAVIRDSNRAISFTPSKQDTYVPSHNQMPNRSVGVMRMNSKTLSLTEGVLSSPSRVEHSIVEKSELKTQSHHNAESHHNADRSIGVVRNAPHNNSMSDFAVTPAQSKHKIRTPAHSKDADGLFSPGEEQKFAFSSTHIKRALKSAPTGPRVAGRRSKEPEADRIGDPNELIPVQKLMESEGAISEVSLRDPFENGNEGLMSAVSQSGKVIQSERSVSKEKEAKSHRAQADEDGYFDVSIAMSDDGNLNHRYVVEGELGRGAYASVIRAFDSITGVSVAIKISRNRKIFFKHAMEEYSLIKRVHEMRLCPYIIEALDGFEYEGHYCIVMKMLSENLHELNLSVKCSGFSLDVTQLFGFQLLMALERLSASKILHRDLKPENMLMETRNGSKIKLVDFGSAVPDVEGTKRGDYVQSRYYRAPEIIIGLKQTPAMDMWSLGCCLFEFHTGIPLFPGRNEPEMLARQVATLGMPPSIMIQEGKFSSKHFVEEFDENGEICYSLLENDSKIEELSLTDLLDDVKRANRGRRGHSDEDYKCFEDILLKMLNFDPSSRITPRTALRHPFFRLSKKKLERITERDNLPDVWANSDFVRQNEHNGVEKKINVTFRESEETAEITDSEPDRPISQDGLEERQHRNREYTSPNVASPRDTSQDERLSSTINPNLDSTTTTQGSIIKNSSRLVESQSEKSEDKSASLRRPKLDKQSSSFSIDEKSEEVDDDDDGDANYEEFEPGLYMQDSFTSQKSKESFDSHSDHQPNVTTSGEHRFRNTDRLSTTEDGEEIRHSYDSFASSEAENDITVSQSPHDKVQTNGKKANPPNYLAYTNAEATDDSDGEDEDVVEEDAYSRGDRVVNHSYSRST